MTKWIQILQYTTLNPQSGIEKCRILRVRELGIMVFLTLL